MKLQIAVDIADTYRILEIASQIHDVIDIYEVGTPVIMKEGMFPVKMLKKAFPNLCVLADTKIMDGGSIECQDVCDAGADIVTVLALADDETIRELVEVAHKNSKQVMADMIREPRIQERAKQLLTFGVDLIGVHTGVDMQKQGRTPLQDLATLVESIPSSYVTVAGGVNMNSIDEYVALHPKVIIAGGSLYNSQDIRRAVIEMKGHLDYDSTK